MKLHLCDVMEQETRIMDVQLVNLQQLCGGVMRCFNQFVESMPQKITAILKAKEHPTWY